MVAIVSVMCVVASWWVYDLLCRSRLADASPVLAVLFLAWLMLLALVMAGFVGARMTFMELGAVLGTVMVANVILVVSPAFRSGQPPDSGAADDANRRLRHNQVMAWPVLFAMVGAHYPALIGHPKSWMALVAVSLAGMMFHLGTRATDQGIRPRWLLPASVVPLLAAGIVLQPVQEPSPATDERGYPSTAQILPVVQARCVMCHATQPAHPGFAAAAAGIVLEDIASIDGNDERVYRAAVIGKPMPLADATKMTLEEKELVAAWYEGRLRRRDAHE
jgi:uncharacterized membrane protein